MKLLDSNEVCDLLGISKSTLYRWCGVSDDLAVLRSLDAAGAGLTTSESLDLVIERAGSAAMRRLQSKISVEETPSDFPRPFKIGRSFKWKDVEIMDWLETRRV